MPCRAVPLEHQHLVSNGFNQAKKKGCYGLILTIGFAFLYGVI